MHTENAFHQLASSCADQTANAQNLAFADLQADALDLVVCANDVLCLESDFADRCFQLGIYVGDFTANHHLDQLVFGQILGFASADVLTVAVNTDPVADREDLCHTMGNVDDRNALFLQAANVLEQQLHFALGDGGGGLVHDDDLGVDRDGLDDLDQLALCNGQVAQGLLGRHVQAALFNQALCLFDLGLLVDQTIFPQFAADKNVFIHGHIQDGIQLLVDHCHTHVHCLFGIGYNVGFSVKEDLTAGIFGIDTHQNLHQGGFTGAVFSHESMDFTRFDLQLYMIKRNNTRESFADIFHFKHIFHAGSPLLYVKF